jgi:hypothetical protein
MRLSSTPWFSDILEQSGAPEATDQGCTTCASAVHVLRLTTLVSADNANTPASPRLDWKAHEPTRSTRRVGKRRCEESQARPPARGVDVGGPSGARTLYDSTPSSSHERGTARSRERRSGIPG